MRRFWQLCHSHIVHGGGRGGLYNWRRGNSRASDDLLNRITFEVIKDGHNLLVTLSRLEREFNNVDTNSTTIGGCGSGDGGRGSNNKIGEPSSNLIILDSNSGCLSFYLYGEGNGGSSLVMMNKVSLSFRCLTQ